MTDPLDRRTFLQLDRRTFLQAAVGAGLGGPLLAGCAGPDRQPRQAGDGTGERGASPGPGPQSPQRSRRHDGPTGTGSRGTMGPHHHDGPAGPRGTVRSGDGDAVESWLADADNFTRVVDRTGRAAATVRVGSQGNGGYFGYGPPAVRVSRGTTVTWSWTGRGGAHDVAARDGGFASDLTAAADAAFERTFDAAGTVPYYCTPHRGIGMKGVVVVD